MSIVYGEERELFQDENYPDIDDHITHDSHEQHHSETPHDTQQQQLEHPLHDSHPQAHNAHQTHESHEPHHSHDSNNHQELTEQHHGSPDTDRFTNANDVVVSDLSSDLVEVARATCNAHAAAAAAGAAFGAVQSTDPRLNNYLTASAPEPEPQPAPVSVDVPVSISLTVQASLPIQLAQPLEQQQPLRVHPQLAPELRQQLQPLTPAAPSPPSHPQEQSPTTPAPSGRIKPIPKPVRQATKNAEGKFVCMWPGCAEDVKEFGRKCEWNKHMDKHDRPYKCGAVGCEKLPGFTYSGGLLRHEREVHGKHGGPKNPLHCPHESCKRATGKGFSRLENLNEHLRRVHTHNADGTTNGIVGMMISNGGGLNVGDESDEATSDDTSLGGGQAQAQAAGPGPGPSQLLLKRKRRRDEDGVGGGETSELREEIKRLRQENEELREQVQKNTQQTTLLVQKLQALTEAMSPRNNMAPTTAQMAAAAASSY
ncbi:hypothetical protein B0H65DRAFT_96251 [Neurospora tetraspora]|uniref:C2H2-type domain-containing protein n=1 Tax=Neurospora tetraspora TaxID=94610 RepID=A0AAE0MTN0_9PEZI|nr:hypothetical protein B0H65DRAFT_96251 [Neurospora tetraspora]